MASFNTTWPSDLLTTNASEAGPHCVSRQKPAFLIFCVLPSLAILINVVILIAVLRKTRKLMRQSHVYAHVSSTLIANVLFSVLALVELLSLYFHFGGLPNDPNPGRRGLIQPGASRIWAFRKSFLCAIFVIMCGNIGLLIDAIRHNTCSTLRSAAGCRSNSEHHGRWKKKVKSNIPTLRNKDVRNNLSSKRRKRLLTRLQRSYVLIAILWIVPVIYVVIPVVGWSCREVCLCLSQCFPAHHVYHESDHKCSRSVPPMSNSWLAVVVAAWAFCLIAIVFFLRRSLQQVTKMWSRCHPTSSVKDKNSKTSGKHGRNSARQSMVAIMDDVHGVSVSDERGKDEVFSSENSDKTEKSSDSCAEKSTCAEESGFLELPNEDKVADEKMIEGCAGRNNFCAGGASRQTRQSETSFGSIAKLKASGPRRMMEHLRATRSSTFTLRYVIWLTVSFGLLTAPAMAIITVDMLYPDLVLNMVALNICLLCPFVYCYICPFVLVKCLPGVKTSLSALILSVYSTTD